MEIKIKVWAETNRVGSRNEKTLTVEVDDDATQKDIEDACDEVANDIVFELIEYGYELLTE